jgi:hypothetical protein
MHVVTPPTLQEPYLIWDGISTVPGCARRDLPRLSPIWLAGRCEFQDFRTTTGEQQNQMAVFRRCLVGNVSVRLSAIRRRAQGYPFWWAPVSRLSREGGRGAKTIRVSEGQRLTGE